MYWKHDFISQAPINATQWAVQHAEWVWPRVDTVGNPDGYVFLKWFVSTNSLFSGSAEIPVFTNLSGDVLTAYPFKGGGSTSSPAACPSFINANEFTPKY